MTTFASALAPIMGLILVGFALKRWEFLPEQAWAGMEKLTYFVLFPALLIRSLGSQSIDGAPWLTMLWVIVATLFASAILLILIHKLWPFSSGATFTSVFQGGVRFNTFIALAVAQSFFAAKGLELGSIAAGFMIVLINLMCISAFAVWGKNGVRGFKPFVREIVFNPLLIACAIGWLLSLTEIGLPGVTGDFFEILGRAALPFGLLAVGAALKPEMIRGHARAIAVSSVVQFMFKPVMIFFLAQALGLNEIATAVLIIAFSVPTASSGYILARQLGGDTETMASIITAQTFIAFLAMPVIAYLML